jgi:transmembrane sensor
MPLQGLLSDAYSGTAERRTLSLPDGSLLTLNARTAVDIHFSASLRSLHLLQGELCVQVAADNRRPLEVLTAQGSVRALGTRFSVRQMAEDSLVGVQQHCVQVTNRSGQQALVSSGQALRFASDRLLLLSGDQSHVDAWMRGRLDVENESLGTVVDALRPYRQGLLRISRAAAQLRVFGVFSLDDSDRALQSLAQVLPITVNQYGPLTLIDVS